MAYVHQSQEMGLQAIADTSTTQQHPLGKRVKASDSTYGEGEFVYGKGVASTAIGDVVILDQKLGTTVRVVTGSRGPVGVAMSANVASQYGWYQIAGSAVVNAGTVVAGGACFIHGTAGKLDDAVVATDKIEGARFKSADGTPSAGFAVVQLDRPSANGNG